MARRPRYVTPETTTTAASAILPKEKEELGPRCTSVLGAPFVAKTRKPNFRCLACTNNEK